MPDQGELTEYGMEAYDALGATAMEELDQSLMGTVLTGEEGTKTMRLLNALAATPCSKASDHAQVEVCRWGKGRRSPNVRMEEHSCIQGWCQRVPATI